MEIRVCTLEDAAVLASLNKQLIEDEKSDNPMDMQALQARMRGFLEGEYCAWFFMEEGQIVGYALVKTDCKPLYLRQFFICREHRKRHFGTQAFSLLRSHLGVETLELDVLPWNEAGRAFWKKCGLKEGYIRMRI